MWRRALWIFLAVLIAPWSAIIAVVIYLIVAGVFFGQQALAVYYSVYIVAAVALSYPVVVLAGIPGHLLLTKFEFNYIWAHAVLGVVVGIIYGIFFMGLSPIDHPRDFVSLSLLLILVGSIVATVFGAIATVPIKKIGRMTKPSNADLELIG